MEVVVAAASPGQPGVRRHQLRQYAARSRDDAGFQNGNVVDCYGTLAAVGENSGYSVALFDISTPASPVQKGSVKTGFQIGSISILRLLRAHW